VRPPPGSDLQLHPPRLPHARSHGPLGLACHSRATVSIISWLTSGTKRLVASSPLNTASTLSSGPQTSFPPQRCVPLWRHPLSRTATPPAGGTYSATHAAMKSLGLPPAHVPPLPRSAQRCPTQIATPIAHCFSDRHAAGGHTAVALPLRRGAGPHERVPLETQREPRAHALEL